LNYLDRFSRISSNVKFHENAFSGSQVGKTDMTKLIVTFCSFVNVLNKKDEWLWHVANVGKMTTACKILVGEL
jgi:hypothetical protein